MPGEFDDAVALANRVLDRPNADPDDDLALLARQFLRAVEARDRWHSNALVCCWCQALCASLEDLRRHTETCPKHPVSAARAEIGRLQAELAEEKRRDANAEVVRLATLERMEQRQKELEAEAARLRDAIRKHRDQRGDDRCWLDDQDLYMALGPESINANTALPPRDQFLESCRRFWDQRQAPHDGFGRYSCMTLAQLEATLTAVRQAAAPFVEYAARLPGWPDDTSCGVFTTGGLPIPDLTLGTCRSLAESLMGKAVNTDDLPTRLRKTAEKCHDMDCYTMAALCNEAAAEIGRLQALCSQAVEALATVQGYSARVVPTYPNSREMHQPLTEIGLQEVYRCDRAKVQAALEALRND